jgi:hypothetical protein
MGSGSSKCLWTCSGAKERLIELRNVYLRSQMRPECRKWSKMAKIGENGKKGLEGG